MKIAQIAPLIESVPPKFYGGTERVVHYLTESLVSMGHEITLFASGDSITSARLVATCEKSLRKSNLLSATPCFQVIQLKEIMRLSHEFDLLHFHTDFLHFPWLSQTSIPHLTTLHGRQDLQELKLIYKHFPNETLVSISDNQRKPVAKANFLKTVYHGLPEDLHKKGEGKGGYLAFLGRISPEKGIDQAIQIAIKANIPLKIAAKIDPLETSYFEDHIKQLMHHPLIEFGGEISEAEKTDFLGSAMALLFPICWEEPFGMVLIESMSCGTPVIAYARGSVTEIIQDGVDGFLVNNVEQALAALKNVESLNRSVIRGSFEQKFTAKKMAKNYIETYEKAIASTKKPSIRSLIQPKSKLHNPSNTLISKLI